ncbi:hypothetical protein ACH5RR_009550 [Cinchona calisaya]|uniref:Glabrous enhancer-binding protein-like DBD domain-containing protein n=1 Tax=Cinchona calisaya TaxID=153742 RepID=A0ABD3AGH9_9GENT
MRIVPKATSLDFLYVQTVTNARTTAPTTTHHSGSSDTPTLNPSGEKSCSAYQSNNVSSADDTPRKPPSADQSSTNNVTSGLSNPGSSSLENLNQQGGDTPASAARDDINILTKMVAYYKANNEVYPSVSAERLADFVKNWLISDAEPVQVGKRIQELREMYGEYLIYNNNDEGGKQVYSDSPDGRLLSELSKKL